jgi:hypothetical protein
LGTFLEHWWVLGLGVLAFVAAKVFELFSALDVMELGWCLGMVLGGVLLGLGLMLYARVCRRVGGACSAERSEGRREKSEE